MTMGNSHKQPAELLPGSVDLLILKALVRGPRHGYAIAKYIRETSDEALFARGEFALYSPAAATSERLGVLVQPELERGRSP